MNGFACLFPGQGSQAIGMGREFFERSSLAKHIFEQADEALGYKISNLCFEGPENELKLTRNTQPALLTVSWIAYSLLDIEPEMAAGHSLGEYSALVAAGALAFSDAVKVVHQRGIYMQDSVPVGLGAMAALLGAQEGDLHRRLGEVKSGVVEVANWNSPEQIVIAGHKEAVEEALRLVKPARFVMLPVSAPFHTRLMRPAEDRLSADLERIRFRDLKFPVITNVDAKPIRTGNEARDSIKKQVSRPVLWSTSMNRFREAGIKICVETGPGKILSGLMKRISRGWPNPPLLANIENWETLETARRTLSGIV